MKLIRSMILTTSCLGIIALPLVVLAQADLQRQVTLCSVISNVAARVECYDRLAAPMTEQTPPSQPSAATPPAPASATTVTTPVTNQSTIATTPKAPAAPEAQAAKIEKFGKATPATIEADAKGDEVLIDTVVAIKEVGPNKLQITLSSGQVWQQMIGKSFPLSANDRVSITKSPWGSSHRLEIKGKTGFIQIQRLR